MPDFFWVKNPVFPPTICAGCNTHAHKDGFVDLLAEDAAGRRFYLCAGCVNTAGNKVGALSKAQGDDLRGRLAGAQEELLALQGELEAERENKVVSLADARKLFNAKSPAAA